MKLKKYNRLTEKDISLREMANLRTKDTGLSKGTIYISTEEDNHGPRVKFFRDRPSNHTKSTSITISSKPQIVEDSLNLTNNELKEISQFILLNMKELLKFWNEGNTWYSDEVELFLKNLKKIR